MTDRHPMDCLLTPPDAAIALGRWLIDIAPTESFYGSIDPGPLYDGHPILDPFAGPGSLLGWTLSVTDFRLADVHAWDMDTRWGPELRKRINPLNVRVGRDSFALDWQVRGRRPHIITNPPYRGGLALKAAEKVLAHCREHRRWGALLLRTDVWQHPGFDELLADFYLPLKFRPVYGLNKHGKFGTESGGAQWVVYGPDAPEPREQVRPLEFLQRPSAFAERALSGDAKEMVAEHRRLARIAHQMGAAMAQGE